MGIPILKSNTYPIPNTDLNTSGYNYKDTNRKNTCKATDVRPSPDASAISHVAKGIQATETEREKVVKRIQRFYKSIIDKISAITSDWR